MAHESGHVLAYEERFIEGERKTIKEYFEKRKRYGELPWLVKNSEIGEKHLKELNIYYRNHKKTIDDYTDKQWKERMGKKETDPARWDHGASNFYPAYEKCFKGLLTNYAIYNYNNSPFPRSFEEVRDYKPKSNKN